MKIIRTRISFKIPRGYFGKIYARSNLAVRCTEVGGGVIDANHRGSVAVIYFNFSEKSVDIGKGDRFCQVVFHKTANDPVLREVDNFKDKNDRGEGYFSSTTIKNTCR